MVARNAAMGVTVGACRRRCSSTVSVAARNAAMGVAVTACRWCSGLGRGTAAISTMSMAMATPVVVTAGPASSMVVCTLLEPV